jgi:AraC-like DNA-binding protein
MLEIDFCLSYIDVMNNFYEYLRKQSNIPIPQILGIEHGGLFYHFILNTFHLNEHLKPCLRGFPQEHAHNVFHIVFYTAENEPNRFMLEGAPVKSYPDMVVLLPPGIPHCFTPLDRGHYCYHEMTFVLQHQGETQYLFKDDFNSLFEKYGSGRKFNAPAQIRPGKSRTVMIGRMYEKIAEAIEESRKRDFFPAYAQMSSFIFFLMRELSATDASSAATSAITPLTVALEFMERYSDKNPNLAEIAAAASISREHLCRIFKTHFGTSPARYCNELRISAAEQLLQNSSISLTEISTRLGFADIYSFSKIFKKTTGIPPSKFRMKGNI